MFRALTILAAVVTLAVSAAPASAVGGKMHYEDVSLGFVTHNKATCWWSCSR